MSYSVEKLPDEPIVVTTLHADYSNDQDGEASMIETVALLDAQSEAVYYIFDVSRYSPSFDDVIAAVNWGGPGKSPTLRHPNVREPLIVTHSSMVKLAAQGLKSATWGHLIVQVFGTVEEALAYARQ